MLSVLTQLRTAIYFSTILTDKTYIIANIPYITTEAIGYIFHILYKVDRLTLTQIHVSETLLLHTILINAHLWSNKVGGVAGSHQ